MANQPIKKKFDYERYFSNEIKRLFGYISSEVANEIPFTTITFDIFLIAGLEVRDSMLYKAINGFMTSDAIDNVHEAIYSLIIDKKVAPVRPNRTIEFSTELKNLFVKTGELMNELGVDTITSDMVFTTFMRNSTAKNKIRQLFISEGIDEEKAFELSKKVRDTMTAISTMDDDTFDNFSDRYSMSVDLGNGADATAMMVVHMDVPEEMSSQDLARELKKALIGDIGDAEEQKPVRRSGKSINVDFCDSLNALAERGELETVIGREEEMREIARVLGRKTNNNVILIGDPGVGKTAVVNGLAKRIVDGNAPQFFKGSTIWRLNISALVGGTQFRGQFEAKINSIIKELKSASKSILFIDNIHNFTTDRNKNEFDLFSALDPVFSSKDIMVITTTTKKGYHLSFETTPETERKFQKIYIEEPNSSECKQIVEGIIPEYESYHGVKYEPEAIDACMSLSTRYITDRRLPASAIDILDEAGSIKKLSSSSSKSLFLKQNKIISLEEEKDKLIREDKLSRINDINYEISGLKIQIAEEEEKNKKKEAISVTVEDICLAVSKHTGIPVTKLNASEKQQLSKISDILRSVIVGQDEAIDIVSRGIKRNKVGLAQSNKPILSAMFIGNTGCGKTLFAKTLAKEIFGSEKHLVRFDMSEYSDETAVNKLIGASAGYVGYNEGGLLTEAIKNKKHCVILIDEIEKATDKIFNVFLQILDEGFITDNTGYKVDFKNVILIMTSNVGAKKAANEKTMGFEVDKNASKKDVIEKELKNRFPPEFLNRLDDIVYFNALSDDNLKEIIRLEILKLSENVKKLGFSLTFTDDVVNAVFDEIGEEKEYGARPIVRIIRREIENKITDLILENDYKEKEFQIITNEGKINVL